MSTAPLCDWRAQCIEMFGCREQRLRITNAEWRTIYYFFRASPKLRRDNISLSIDSISKRLSQKKLSRLAIAVVIECLLLRLYLQTEEARFALDLAEYQGYFLLDAYVQTQPKSDTYADQFLVLIDDIYSSFDFAASSAESDSSLEYSYALWRKHVWAARVAGLQEVDDSLFNVHEAKIELLKEYNIVLKQTSNTGLIIEIAMLLNNFAGQVDLAVEILRNASRKLDASNKHSRIQLTIYESSILYNNNDLKEGNKLRSVIMKMLSKVAVKSIQSITTARAIAQILLIDLIINPTMPTLEKLMIIIRMWKSPLILMAPQFTIADKIIDKCHRDRMFFKALWMCLVSKTPAIFQIPLLPSWIKFNKQMQCRKFFVEQMPHKNLSL